MVSEKRKNNDRDDADLQKAPWEREGKRQDVISEVQETDFDQPLADLVTQYNRRIGIRGEYLWKWLCTCFPFVTLDAVPDSRRRTLCTHKTILSMFVTLVDDLADNYRDEESFREATKIPFDGSTARLEREEVRTDYLRFLTEVWGTFESFLVKYERESEFRSLFKYDLRQSLNAMDYERLANDRPEIMNTPEMMSYTPHNMAMMAAADIDMMNSPELGSSATSDIREAVYGGQKLVRISNWLSTWEREIDEGDFTSVVFTNAIDRDVLSAQTLDTLRRNGDDIDSQPVADSIHASGLERDMLNEWEQRYKDLATFVNDVDTADLNSFVNGVDKVRNYHMASKGYK
jgi:hypothetical protein